MSRSTFENTYPKYPFAPLVELGMRIGQFAKAKMDRSAERSDHNGAHGLTA